MHSSTYMIIFLASLVVLLSCVIVGLMARYLFAYRKRLTVVKATLETMESHVEADIADLKIFFEDNLQFDSEKSQKLSQNLINDRYKFYRWLLEMYFNRRIIEVPKMRQRCNRLIKPYIQYMKLFAKHPRLDKQSADHIKHLSSETANSEVDNQTELKALKQELALASSALAITYKEYVNLFGLDKMDIDSMSITDIAQSLGLGPNPQTSPPEAQPSEDRS